MDKNKAEKCHAVIRSMKDTHSDQEKFFGQVLQERERYSFLKAQKKKDCQSQPCLTQ